MILLPTIYYYYNNYYQHNTSELIFRGCVPFYVPQTHQDLLIFLRMPTSEEK